MGLLAQVRLLVFGFEFIPEGIRGKAGVGTSGLQSEHF